MNPNRNPPDEDSESANRALLESLRDAYSPDTISLELNDRLIEAALLSVDSRALPPPCPELPSQLPSRLEMDPDATSAERLQAEGLANALVGRGEHPLALVAELIRNAHAPLPVAPAVAEEFANACLRLRDNRSILPIRRLSYATAALAVAASVALWVSRREHLDTEQFNAPQSSLAQSRSVAPLFAETFDTATSTERIDRIYAARSRELRHNRYVSWRVR